MASPTLVALFALLLTAEEPMKAEAPRLPTEAEAKELWSKLLAKAKAPDRDCAALIGPHARLAFTIANPTTDEVKADLAAYLWMARCAEKQRYYVLLLELSARMVKADPKKGHPELLARAYLGLDMPKHALEVLDLADKQLPKDSDVALTGAKTACRLRDWAGCLKQADKTVKLAQALKGDEKNQVLNRAQKYRARALLHLGKMADAEKALALSEKLGGDKADLEELRDALVPAKTFQAVVETEHVADVALGIYHLLGKREGSRPLVQIHLANLAADRQFRVEVQLDGVTSHLTKTVTLLKGKASSVGLTPPLLSSFDVKAVRAAKKAQLDVKVVALGSSGEVVVHHESAEVTLEPRDFLPMAAFVDEEHQFSQNLYTYMGAWVTPNAKAIDAFLADAKQVAPRQTFSGEQSATVPQVKAIFETLKARGVSYVLDPDVASGVGSGQRTRLPTEVLASTNAQCLEGALLYASLFEAIGLHGVIILVPGHALVAWQTSPADGEALKGKVLVLETTMTHDAPFEKAVQVGVAEYNEAHAKEKAQVMFVDELRSIGITPQPFE